MVKDAQFQDGEYHPWEQKHHYGSKVHLVGDRYNLGVLAQFCAKNTGHSALHGLVRQLYRDLLFRVLSAEFPRHLTKVETAMAGNCLDAWWEGVIVDDSTSAVVVDISRAGDLPSQLVFDILSRQLKAEGVRKDHIYSQRVTDPTTHQVIGANLSGSKIGGLIAGRYLICPDPMGATGSTIVEALAYYRSRQLGAPAKVILVHLIVTPEYLRCVTEKCPEATVYALRLDRGLSPLDVLQTVPGERWSEERGLTNHGYIVPGAGDIGARLNNTPGV